MSQDKTAEQLMACPFCGCHDHSIMNPTEFAGSPFVQCNSCGASGGTRGHEDEAISDWNTRADSGEAVAWLTMAYRAGFIKACNWPAPVSQDVDSPAFAKDLRIFLEAHASLFPHPSDTAVDVRDAARWRQFVEMIDPDKVPGGFTVYYAMEKDTDQLCYFDCVTELVDAAIASREGEGNSGAQLRERS